MTTLKFDRILFLDAKCRPRKVTNFAQQDIKVTHNISYVQTRWQHQEFVRMNWIRYIYYIVSFSVAFCSSVESFCESGIEIDESLNSLQQDDPALIEAIRNLLIHPDNPSVPYNFSVPNPELHGQFGQVIDLKELLDKQKSGFFIEAGAYDGEMLSNSLYFEKEKGWSGLLVEPNPDTLAELLHKKRRAIVFPRCLSTKTTPEVIQFDAAGLLGGIIHKGRNPGGIVLDSEIFGDIPTHETSTYNRRTVKMQCFPLYSVLLALGNPTVDLFSLDIEGAELQVLKTIPWDKVKVRVLLIEVNHIGEIFKGSPKDLIKLMKKNSFKFFRSSSIDDIYVKRDFKVIDDTAKTEL